MPTLELTAVRANDRDVNLADALDRVHDLEYKSLDDATWAAMVTLAKEISGDRLDRLKEDRRWGSVQAWSGPTLVDVLWHGQGVNIWYSPGLDDDEFYAVLNRLRDAGFTITQGDQVTEVPPSVTVSEMTSAQEADQHE